jgi:hypothetical protein
MDNKIECVPQGCLICGEQCSDLLVLFEHIIRVHPEVIEETIRRFEK